MGVIFTVFLIILLLVSVKKIIVGGVKLTGALVVFGTGALCLPAVIAGYSMEWVGRKLHLRLAVSVIASLFLLLASIGFFVSGSNTIEALSFQAAKYVFTTILMVVSIFAHRKFHNSRKLVAQFEYLDELDRNYFRLLIGTAGLVFMSMAGEGYVLVWRDALSWLYWTMSILTIAYAIGEQLSAKSVITKVARDLATETKMDITEYIDRIEDGALGKEGAEKIFYGIYHHLLHENSLMEMEVGGKNWVINKDWYQQKRAILAEESSKTVKNDLGRMVGLTSDYFDFSHECAQDFVDRHVDFGKVYEFDDGDYFVNFSCEPRIKTCCSCGVTVEKDHDHDDTTGEWFCSDICHSTEQHCLDIFERDHPIIDRAVDGAVVSSISNMYRQNHKVFAAGGQGHGFAAENANTYIDRLQGKSAKVIGDDNALNGADRLVNGVEIQTKYCKTAARSVGAAFDGQDGNYRYFDSQTRNPMQIEVPRDQYAAAVGEMEKKISAGKVPGVSDPLEAKNLVKAGSLTYDQARNITKFGTIESLSFDLSEGAIIGLTAGGISFGISAFVFYANTQDLNASLRAAVVQAGKTAVRSTTVYVATQQLHRLGGVQSMLKVVDATSLSPTTCGFLQKGFGVSNKGAMSNAMRGALVSSVVIIAMTTGPDLIKMIRGRISKAQFIKNVAVATGGVVGGVAGSIIGGAAGAALGPAGMVVGRIIGGAIGGAATAAVTNKIAGKFMVEDRERMLRILQKQLEYLAYSFVFTEDEISRLQESLSGAITQDKLEAMHASGNVRAVANAITKPHIVDVVRKRMPITIDMNEVDLACSEVIA